MSDIIIVSRNGSNLGLIERDIQIGTKGKLKGRQYVRYRNKRYIVEKDRFGILSIFPWGFK